MKNTTPKDETYNGWTNYATWNAHLWLTSNDEPTYKLARRIVRNDKIREITEQALSDLLLVQQVMSDQRVGFFSDLNTEFSSNADALDAVNWQEVIDAIASE